MNDTTLLAQFYKWLRGIPLGQPGTASLEEKVPPFHRLSLTSEYPKPGHRERDTWVGGAIAHCIKGNWAPRKRGWLVSHCIGAVNKHASHYSFKPGVVFVPKTQTCNLEHPRRGHWVQPYPCQGHTVPKRITKEKAFQAASSVHHDRLPF